MDTKLGLEEYRFAMELLVGARQKSKNKQKKMKAKPAELKVWQELGIFEGILQRP